MPAVDSSTAGKAEASDRAKKHGRVVYHASLSLDGFVAGPRDSLEWAFRCPERNPTLDAAIRNTGAVLIGRNSFDAVRGRPPSERHRIYGEDGSIPRFVLTHRPIAGAGAQTLPLSTDVGEAVRCALAAADGKDVATIGANVAGQALRLGLVDELLVHLVPSLLGSGVRFYSHDAGGELELDRLSISVSGPVTNLRFGVRRAVTTGPSSEEL